VKKKWREMGEEEEEKGRVHQRRGGREEEGGREGNERGAFLNKRSGARGNLLFDWRRSFLLVNASSASAR